MPALRRHATLLRGSEWGVNQHRDSLALYVGFDPLSQYIAIAENESIGRVKFNCLQVSLSTTITPDPTPCSPSQPMPWWIFLCASS